MAASSPKKTSTQNFMEIAEVHDGVIILKDGSLRAVLLVSSINFALKSEEEKDGIIYSFQNFLNYLSFDIQVLIRSRRLDLKDYLVKMNEVAGKQKNELLRAQTEDYIAFINSLLEVANIMDKQFYVVIPFYPPMAQTTGKMINKVKGNKQNQPTSMSAEEFEGNRLQLIQRVDVISGHLSSMGLRCASLDTQELIELFYQSYNPETAQYQRLTDIKNITNNVIHSGSTRDKGTEELEI
ncbi:MAG: hypothetical protein UT66_C0026G0015 [candidate division CPR2 bacterium GW2011_GWC1_39_9]|uniref:TraC-like domain-containing protein n=1 Tax=candidate division CPR2 bacterium GW2011_GWC2_39_10 TaxID=1618345 RepID=A0A0G0PA43_UNCC2|nr:MAG: hypothetical protein UT18_C0005G0024 [candidate division CPR2 bacterium GW2011_GWC2_39_10]KKR34263.1 MAG: hypothetical protein UT66_C0026G0015 [candidate division CPR2 bacterium GW2011_GWC1_39_9]